MNAPQCHVIRTFSVLYQLSYVFHAWMVVQKSKHLANEPKIVMYLPKASRNLTLYQHACYVLTCECLLDLYLCALSVYGMVSVCCALLA
jgi:hypothetical protein